MTKTDWFYYLFGCSLTLGATIYGCAHEEVVATSEQVEIPCNELAGAAVADDYVDDRAALQMAIDAASLDTGCLLLGPGRYDVERNQALGTTNRPSLKVTRPLVLRGAGRDATTLAMMGSGIKEGTSVPADWVLLQIGSDDVTVEDLRLDGADRYETNEQTHLVEVVGPSRRTRLQRLDLFLPVIGPNSGGDCIRLLGSFDSRIRATVVTDATGLECDRSWVSIQRGVHNTTLQDSSTLRVGDQAIDLEPTAHEPFCENNSEPSITELRMQRLNLQRGDLGRGSYTVAIAGAAACAPASGVWLTDSTLGQGGVWLHNTQRTQLLRLRYDDLPSALEVPDWPQDWPDDR